LDWALNLEQQGIIDEEMSFSQEERERAVSSSIVNNIHAVTLTMVGTNMGQMSDSATINTRYEIGGNVVNTVENALSEVRKNLEHLPASERDDVEAHVEAASEELESGARRPNRLKSSLQAILRVVKPLTSWTGKAIMESALDAGIRALMQPPT
jgi:hypothetical protein